jgi:hypothetical protein
MTNSNQLAVKIVLDAWFSNVKRTDEVFNKLTDEELMNEIAPGKNRVIYLLGHLTAVHDRMLPLLNLDERAYPQLDDIFLTSPDKSVTEIPSAINLRAFWKGTNEKLEEHFKKLQADEWIQKHNSVSSDDFVKEPHRNRLNVVLGRTNHLSYHLGQLALLK